MTHALTSFENMDIRTLIDGQSVQYGDRPFLIWEPFEGEGSSWTYSVFASRIRRFAAGLQALGIHPGDRVIVHMNNSPEQVIAWLGCAYAGAVPVTTNTASSGEDIDYFATHSAARIVITEAEFAALVVTSAPGIEFVYAAGNIEGFAAKIRPLTDIDGDPVTLIERPHDPMAPFGIQYTSGTTSRPKAVLWTHANALWGARQSAAHEDLRHDDIQLVHMPLFHTNAQVYSVLASLWVGATCVLQPKFSASRFWPVSVKHRCTFTSVIPFVWNALKTQPVPAESRYRIWGSPICDAPTDAYFGVKSLGWWGMTETITHPIVGSPHHADAPMSMGRPAPEYEIHILDGDMQPVKIGETGDLYVRGIAGVSLFSEYVSDPVATADAYTADGLFITGDRARLGPSGHIYFADRSKDMMKCAGENVAASEVERVILETGQVAEVAVVAKPHPMRGQVPAAFVIPGPAAGDNLIAVILESCQKRLASFKVPDEIRLVSELPRAALNKVAKNELRALLQREADNIQS
jgi:carnitine-CoA ligase